MKVNGVVEKVTAFVTRERDGVRELLVFKHPKAGIQIPAGTVEDGENPETAVKREVYEETGLQNVKIEKSLGYIENELEEGERIIAQATQVYIKPNLSSIPYKEKLTRGLTVDYNSTHKDFSYVSYVEYDRFPNPTCVLYNITGWVPNENLSSQKARHFFQLTTLKETVDEWEVKSDRDHIFKLYWTPLSPKPRIVSQQDKWLDFVYEKIH
jgi:8-oxo-dGTP pyrophosphatase MutT (NUDIX family)